MKSHGATLFQPLLTSFLHISCYDERLVGYADSVSNGLTDAYIQDVNGAS